MKKIKDKIIAMLFTRYPALFERWARNAHINKYSDTPWTPFDGEISQSRIALITTGGVHLLTQDPFSMKDSSGDPSFREIPANTAPRNLRITHTYYDKSDANKDINIIFPLERLQYLKNGGEIGEVNSRHFSFMGHLSGHHIVTLINKTAPRVATALKSDSVDLVLLTPA